LAANGSHSIRRHIYVGTEYTYIKLAPYFLKDTIMQLKYAKNSVWANAEHTIIDCEINHPTFGWIPFTASPHDVEVHGREIFAALVQGDVAEYIPPPPPTTEELAAAARAERDALLAATDWTQSADVPQATKDKWAPYRQALRDVPEQSGFPSDIQWPVNPE
jgi:hypothetical protein